MLAMQIIGGFLLLVGVVLFVASQWTGGEHSTDDAGPNAWKIEVKGPPGLILIVIGLLTFAFPHTPLWPGEEEPVALPTTTVSTTTTTVVAATTTTLGVREIDPNYYVPNFPDFQFIPDGFEYIYPSAPYDAYIDYGGCLDVPAIFWTPGDGNDLYVEWWVVIDIYYQGQFQDTVEWDSTYGEWDFGWNEFGIPISGLCLWSYIDDPLAEYLIWIYAYNENGFSDPAYISMMGG